MIIIAGIYKAYDIRGIAATELDETLAYDIGRTFVIVKNARGKTLLVGHDMRPTSQPFSRKVIEGMRAEGANVVDAGLVSTSLFYFAARHVDGGCMVTASHNPPEYNGFKFVFKNLPVSYGTGIAEMERLIKKRLPPLSAQGKTNGTTFIARDYLDEFLTFNLGFLTTERPFKMVIDAGNGMGGYTYGKLLPLLEERGIEVVPLFFELDGTFPNHEANPLKPETLVALRQKVLETKGVALGLALDGDEDRCVFLDENGETINSDLTLGLVSERLLEAHGPGVVVHDLRCSRAVREAIIAHGGTPVPSPVGYANIKPLANERGALFGGEISGHFFPKETGYNEDTMFILFELLNLLDEAGKPLSELVAPLRKYAFSGEINSEVADADRTLAAVERRYAALPGIKDLSHLDGVRIEYATWWFSLRKSNTEPVVRLIVEADTQQEMGTRRDELLALIRG